MSILGFFYFTFAKKHEGRRERVPQSASDQNATNGEPSGYQKVSETTKGPSNSEVATKADGSEMENWQPTFSHVKSDRPIQRHPAQSESF